MFEEYPKRVNKAFGIYEAKMIELSDCINLVASACVMVEGYGDEVAFYLDRFVDNCKEPN